MNWRSTCQPGTSDRAWLVAVAAALWGLDGLLRKPLATALAPATVVLWEHLIVVVLVLPWIASAVRAFLRCGVRDRLAIIVIGAGCSATATALFTEAFSVSARTGDFITPLVLQKLQPVFAVVLAIGLLRERLRPGFGMYAVPALVGSWLLSFADPLHVQLQAVQVALLAVGAAFLWGAGTVLGRLVSPSVGPRDLTVLRYVWGLPAALLIVWKLHAPVAPGWSNLTGLVLLATIPGLLALVLYYVGLRSTAASRATFAELAFPATAAIIGIGFLHGSLTASQWVGFVIVVVAVTALSRREHAKRSVLALDPVAVP
jgi:DME family drug/metabolite transporter